MDYNSKKLYLAFLRREEKIKNLIDEVLSNIDESDICNNTSKKFLTEVCWQVSDYFDEEIKEDIIHSWVRENFTTYISHFYFRMLKDCDDDDFDYYSFLD